MLGLKLVCGKNLYKLLQEASQERRRIPKQEILVLSRTTISIKQL